MVRNALPADDHYTLDALFKTAYDKGLTEADIPEGLRMMVHAKRAAGLYWSQVLWVLTLFCDGLRDVMGERGHDFRALARIVGAAYLLLMTSPDVFPFPASQMGRQTAQKSQVLG